MKEHTIRTIRHLLESWVPTHREAGMLADRVETDVDDPDDDNVVIEVEIEVLNDKYIVLPNFMVNGDEVNPTTEQVRLLHKFFSLRGFKTRQITSKEVPALRRQLSSHGVVAWYVRASLTQNLETRPFWAYRED